MDGWNLRDVIKFLKEKFGLVDKRLDDIKKDLEEIKNKLGI